MSYFTISNIYYELRFKYFKIYIIFGVTLDLFYCTVLLLISEFYFKQTLVLKVFYVG